MFGRRSSDARRASYATLLVLVATLVAEAPVVVLRAGESCGSGFMRRRKGSVLQRIVVSKAVRGDSERKEKDSPDETRHLIRREESENVLLYPLVLPK